MKEKAVIMLSSQSTGPGLVLSNTFQILARIKTNSTHHRQSCTGRRERRPIPGARSSGSDRPAVPSTLTDPSARSGGALDPLCPGAEEQGSPETGGWGARPEQPWGAQGFLPRAGRDAWGLCIPPTGAHIPRTNSHAFGKAAYILRDRRYPCWYGTAIVKRYMTWEASPSRSGQIIPYYLFMRVNFMCWHLTYHMEERLLEPSY